MQFSEELFHEFLLDYTKYLFNLSKRKFMKVNKFYNEFLIQVKNLILGSLKCKKISLEA